MNKKERTMVVTWNSGMSDHRELHAWERMPLNYMLWKVTDGRE
jgi:hypothetical protein